MKSTLAIAITVIAVGVAFAMRAQRSAPASEVAAGASTPATAADGEAAPRLTFVELGSDRCTSCRAMIPVLAELRASHGCSLDVEFVDVWADPEAGERYGVSTIPTQILIGPDGNELTRHTGFWSVGAIREAFASHGHPLQVTEAEVCTQ